MTLPVPARSALLNRIDVCRTVTADKKIYVCAEDLLDVFGREAEAWKILQYLEGLRPRTCRSTVSDVPTLYSINAAPPKKERGRWTRWSVVTHRSSRPSSKRSGETDERATPARSRLSEAIARLHRGAAPRHAR